MSELLMAHELSLIFALHKWKEGETLSTAAQTYCQGMCLQGCQPQPETGKIICQHYLACAGIAVKKELGLLPKKVKQFQPLSLQSSAQP